MAKRATYVWRGGAKLLYGETYKPGHVFDDEFVLGLRNRDALLSAGTIKVEVVDVAPPKKEPVASTTKAKKSKASKPKAKTGGRVTTPKVIGETGPEEVTSSKGAAKPKE